jgi:SAM-dependent methyltransferase
MMRGLISELDIFQQEILGGDHMHAITCMTELLTEYRQSLPDTLWQDDIVDQCREHPIFQLLQEDPYTSRAFEKPRGYPGDAVMLDYAYFQNPPPDSSAIGKLIFEVVTSSPNALSVRWRREHIAGLIERLASHRETLSIMSVACGHCRELELLKPETRLRIQRFVAFDNDLETLKLATLTWSEIIEWQCNVKKLPESDDYDGFDFIYSIGIYDYLNRAQAMALTAWLMGKLNPGGKLLIANFTPDNWGRGYMEAFMDWKLVLRTREQMRAFIPADSSPHSCLYFDPYRNVIYLLLTRELLTPMPS